jgi:hypothetical protein
MGERLEATLQAFPSDADHLLINTALLPAAACNDACGTNPDGDFNPCSSPLGYTVGVANHLRWPITYNTAMLDFFRSQTTNPNAPGTPKPLTITSVRVKKQTSGGGNGGLDAMGTFLLATPSDVFDASAAITARLDDGLTLDRSHTWATSECVTRAGRFSCRSADRRARANFRPVPSPPGTYRFKIRMTGLPLDPPFAPPLTLTVMHGSAPTTRQGAIASCGSTTTGLRCRRRR